MNREELDIVLEKAIELLNDKQSILEELKKEQITTTGKKHLAKSQISCGSYILKMKIEKDSDNKDE